MGLVLRSHLGNGYARVFLGIESQIYTNKFSAAVDGEAKNAQTIFFPKATGRLGNDYSRLYSS